MTLAGLSCAHGLPRVIGPSLGLAAARSTCSAWARVLTPRMGRLDVSSAWVISSTGTTNKSPPACSTATAFSATPPTSPTFPSASIVPVAATARPWASSVQSIMSEMASA
jgi:hypothetical protein